MVGPWRRRYGWGDGRARILQIDGDGRIEAVDFDEADPVALTRDFLGAPDRYLRHLLDGDG